MKTFVSIAVIVSVLFFASSFAVSGSVQNGGDVRLSLRVLDPTGVGVRDLPFVICGQDAPCLPFWTDATGLATITMPRPSNNAVAFHLNPTIRTTSPDQPPAAFRMQQLYNTLASPEPIWLEIDPSANAVEHVLHLKPAAKVRGKVLTPSNVSITGDIADSARGIFGTIKETDNSFVLSGVPTEAPLLLAILDYADDAEVTYFSAIVPAGTPDVDVGEIVRPIPAVDFGMVKVKCEGSMLANESIMVGGSRRVWFVSTDGQRAYAGPPLFDGDGWSIPINLASGSYFAVPGTPTSRPLANRLLLALRSGRGAELSTLWPEGLVQVQSGVTLEYTLNVRQAYDKLSSFIGGW